MHSDGIHGFVCWLLFYTKLTPRKGLVIYSVAYDDGSQGQKSVAQIRMMYPDKTLAFVVTMANDKDHSVFSY